MDELQIDKNELLRQFSERVKALRKAGGYRSYEKFAIAKDIGRMQYWRYERGENLRLDNLVRVIFALGYQPDTFFAEGFDWDKVWQTPPPPDDSST